ncbi:hypothetical protein LTR04_002018 [Oleoguttula sp. CCFEE 6159]|nr:hypothetical protein LTR04_002018 [Oleoguttula sp. CCFEE 6159]
MAGPFRLDEGYSEDTRSPSGSDIAMSMEQEQDQDRDRANMLVVPDLILSLSEAQRSEYAYAILRSLKTSSIAAIVERLNPLLHLDPLGYLPPEIVFQVFHYLRPGDLLRASIASKHWRTMSLDSRLWRLLFRCEGWTANTREIRAFEEHEKARVVSSKRWKTRARRPDLDVGRKVSKRRARDGGLFGDGERKPLLSTFDGSGEDPQDWNEQHGTVEADDNSEREDQMQGVEYNTFSSTNQTGVPVAHVDQTSGRDHGPTYSTHAEQHDSLDPPVRPSLLLSSIQEPKINWQYLYKQRRRLEDNWNAGRFVNFQLPHPEHLEERHKECVYCIQFSGKYLVSGSRDKTLRIWNMDTQRLIMPPLKGHTASVLCLQFDERPEEDIVISGGSDADVILWKFSTGAIIKKLTKAHSESVLNLRFDDRYLITCSKDKTIKVWNRKKLMPDDKDYPTSTSGSAIFPSYIFNMENYRGLGYHSSWKPLKEYSLLMTMDGHGAAVNAIEILDGQIVSASGDRKVKVWDIRTGACIMTLVGHTKGIACVQFDGRRIVSGSSDNSVRIFDRATGVEVACLQGHGNLVRTVQARFGDLPGKLEDLEDEAKAVDAKFLAARSNGLPEPSSRAPRNTGSRDPKDILAFGAKIPPGGGGSRWGRIVSGSYDETVIIWKKDHDGKWVKGRTLRQAEAVWAASRRRNADGQMVPIVPPPQPAHLVQAAQALHAAQAVHAVATAAAQQLQHQLQHASANSPATTPSAAMNTLTVGNAPAPTAPHPPLVHPPSQPSGLQHQHQHLPTHAPPYYNALTPQQQQLVLQTIAAQTPSSTAQHQSALPILSQLTPGPPPSVPVTNPANTNTNADAANANAANANASVNTTTNITAAASAPTAPSHAPLPPQSHSTPQDPPTIPQPAQNPHFVFNPHAPAPHLQPAHGTGSARVFKLQFDARRILCCSQNPVIVGWDFANGESEVEEASRFFGE